MRQQLNSLLQLTAAAKEPDDKRTTELYAQGLGSLILASERDEVGYVRDLIDFEVAAIAARNEKAGWLATVALEISSASKGQILEAVVPYLNKPDQATQSVVKRLLYVVEDSSRDGRPDFTHYRVYIQGRLLTQQDVDSALVKQMFRRSPGDAFETYVTFVQDLEQRKPFLWARHVIDDALWKRQYGFVPPKEPDPAVTEQLEKMAARDEWWARLYAAEIIRQHPEFVNEGLIKRLTEDENPLVKETAKAIGKRGSGP